MENTNKQTGEPSAKKMASNHERFQNIPQEIRKDFSEILHSIPNSWGLRTGDGQDLSEEVRDFVIDRVNKYTEENN